MDLDEHKLLFYTNFDTDGSDARPCCDCNFNKNTAAITAARILCEGKSKEEVSETYQFINVLLSAIRSYL